MYVMNCICFSLVRNTMKTKQVTNWVGTWYLDYISSVKLRPSWKQLQWWGQFNFIFQRIVSYNSGGASIKVLNFKRFLFWLVIIVLFSELHDVKENSCANVQVHNIVTAHNSLPFFKSSSSYSYLDAYMQYILIDDNCKFPWGHQIKIQKLCCKS